MAQQNNNSTGGLSLPDVAPPFRVIQGNALMLGLQADKTFTSQAATWTFTPDSAIGQITFGSKGELTVSAPDAASSPLTVNGNTSSFVMAQSGNVTMTGAGLLALNISSGTGRLQINGTQVVGTRKTGWTAWTGTGSRATKAVSTATTADCAAAIKSLLDDLGTNASGHGLLDA